MITIDIFCEIIDNFGDIGVIYRFANELLNKYEHKAKIRVILNQTLELTALDNSAKNTPCQMIKGIEYITFSHLESIKTTITYPQIIVESFGCNIPQWYLEKAKVESTLLINLEYLSSEEWTLDFHLKESLLGALKLRKFFFMPGLNEKSGGVIIPEKTNKTYNFLDYSQFLSKEFLENKLIGSIFSYEKNFSFLFNSLEKLNKESILLCLGEKTQLSIKEILKKENLNFDNIYLGKFKNTHILFLPFMNQDKYDALLSLCDFNFVRGEDSFVRGVLSSKPFLWNAYWQENFAHLDKIEGFFNVFLQFFKTYYPEKYYEELENYHSLLKTYNTPFSNSRKGVEKITKELDLFFSHLETLKEMNKNFSKHINKNCNLIDKFYNFIKLYSNINL